MFEFLKKLSSPSRSLKPSSGQGDVVFLVDLPAIAHSSPATSKVVAGVAVSKTARSTSDRQSSVVASHRERLLAMKLEYLQLCPTKRCAQLAAVGVQTAGDLVFGNPNKIASSFAHPARAERALRRYRNAIRMSLAIESMMPRDALLLVAIHRRSVVTLARESASQLHRDLERFSMSTRGSKLVGRRGIPSLRRVKTWVAACRELAETAAENSSSTQAAAA